MIRQQVARGRSGNPPSLVTTPGGQWRGGAHRATISPGTAAHSASDTSFARFLWIFTTLGLIVVVVVIGFLIGIVRALESIDNGLLTTSDSVSGASSNVQPLPNYIQQINGELSDIDTSLKPIPGQVADVSDSLTSIRGSAEGIDGSLKDTSRSLIDTSGSLQDTSETMGSPSSP